MEWKRRIVCVVLAGVSLPLLSGCATIFSDKKYEVMIDNPGGPTHFAVRDKKNRLVHQGITPQEVTLKARSYPFWPAKYDVSFEGLSNTKGHHELKAGLDPWLAGNVLIGGGLGIVVDGFTGAMFRLPKQVSGAIPAQYAMTDTSQTTQVVSAERTANQVPGKDVRQAGHQRTSSGDMR